jgi:hypothetical protein
MFCGFVLRIAESCSAVIGRRGHFGITKKDRSRTGGLADFGDRWSTPFGVDEG